MTTSFAPVVISCASGVGDELEIRPGIPTGLSILTKNTDRYGPNVIIQSPADAERLRRTLDEAFPSVNPPQAEVPLAGWERDLLTAPSDPTIYQERNARAVAGLIQRGLLDPASLRAPELLALARFIVDGS